MFGVVADKRWKLGYLHSEYSHKCPNSALGDGAPGQNSPPCPVVEKGGYKCRRSHSVYAAVQNSAHAQPGESNLDQTG